MERPRSFITDPDRAAAVLAAGGVVALPTETVYGLGALATDEGAIRKVFEIKGRPATNPLIVHISNRSDVAHWARDVPAYVEPMLSELWPGPLTVVLASSGRACATAQSGYDTVALRAPADEDFLAVLRHLESRVSGPVGIAAPSANRSGQVSPTSAEAVAEELGDRLGPSDGIFLGAPCRVGLESTILLCRPNDATILRPGAVTEADLSAFVALAAAPSPHETPGSSLSHYAPRARVHMLTQRGSVQFPESARVGVIGCDDDIEGAPPQWVRLSSAPDVPTLARQLYRDLRRGDSANLTDIVVVVPSGGGLAAAIRDRVSRAAYRAQ